MEYPEGVDPRRQRLWSGPDPNAPEYMDIENKAGVDEAHLHPCCQKERQAARIKKKVMGKLTEADVTRKALEKRRGVLKTAALVPPAHDHQGPGCCALTADYPVLRELRLARGMVSSIPLPAFPLIWRTFSDGYGGSLHMCWVTTGGGNTDGHWGPSGGDEVVAVVGAGRPHTVDQASDDSEDDEDEELLAGLDPEGDKLIALRLAEMIRKAEEVKELRRIGVGIHLCLPYDDIRNLLHLRMNVVCHLYDPSLHLCAQLDLHLEGLAKMYPGTRFVRAQLGLPGCAEFVDRLRLGGGARPKLAAFRDGCLVDCCKDLAVFGARTGQLCEEAVDQWLEHCHVLIREAPTMVSLQQSMGRAAPMVLDEDDEDGEVEFYDCGLEGCQKTFVHNHVGMGDLPKDFAGV